MNLPYKYKEVWVQTSSSGGLNDNRRVIPVHVIVLSFYPDGTAIMSVVLSLIGYDSISSFWGVGKMLDLNLIRTKPNRFCSFVA